MTSMYIGSGDCAALLAGINSETHARLLRRFVSGVTPHYNALASPIDALRTGAILEDRYFQIMPDHYFAQVKVVCRQQNVLKSSIDFARLEGGRVVDFDELKTCQFSDFLEFESFRGDEPAGVEYIKKRYTHNYNQVQFQLYCTGLDSANIVFLVSYTNNDAQNLAREIKQNEYLKFRIARDESVIEMIRRRAAIFQQIKDVYVR